MRKTKKDKQITKRQQPACKRSIDKSEEALRWMTLLERLRALNEEENIRPLLVQRISYCISPELESFKCPASKGN